MGRSCCVPGCKSNYGVTLYNSVFRFPKNPTLREKWVKCIHRDNFEPNDNSVVCINHLEPKFVLRDDLFPVENGDPIPVPRKNPKLTNDAFPTIFPNQLSYHTTNVPHKRKTPEEREKQSQHKDSENFQHWCENDKIDSFQVFRSALSNKNTGSFLIRENDEYVLFYKLESKGVPSIPVSFKVTSALDVQVFHNNISLPTEHFKWILECGGQEYLKCNRWIKLDTLVSHLGNYSESSIGLHDKLTALIKFLKEALVLYEDSDTNNINKIKFALEQLELCETKQIRYSAGLLVWAATLSYLFPGAYHLLRSPGTMTLPHPVYLRKFLTNFGPNTPGIGPFQKAFLKEKAALLKDHEKVVTLLLDEVYVNSEFTYKAGKILEMAENSTQGEPAGTMQVFMYSSLCSSVKDEIGLFLVKNMNSETPLKLTEVVPRVMHEIGFDDVCIISDNHTTNRKMFELCGGSLKPCIPNSCDSLKSVFLLFDSVHLFPHVEQVFRVINEMSEFTEGTVADCTYTNVEAKFSDLKDLFHCEKNMLLKLAPNLTRKALYTSIERQNVQVAVNIFDQKNIAALVMLTSQGVDISIGTLQFLK